MALAGAAALAAVALLSGNNLVYLVAAPLWAVLVVAVPVGWWNLRGVSVRRALPAELVAGRDAPGKLLVSCRRARLAAAALEVVDEGMGVVGHAERIEPGSTCAVPVRWRFGERGPARLEAVVVRSTFPFGLVEHVVRVPQAAEVLVWPRPHPSGSAPRPAAGTGLDDERRVGGSGDFLGLRAWRDGDSPRRVHWPATARLGQVVVVERASERAPAVLVEVAPAPTGPIWERELSRAAGEIQRALASGYRVGLSLPAVGGEGAREWMPASGGTWRRVLLDALARAPRIEP